MIDSVEVYHTVGAADYVVRCEVYAEPYAREAIPIAIFSAETGNAIPVQDWEAHGFDDDELGRAALQALSIRLRD